MTPSTPDELKAYVWKRLPIIRRNAVGKGEVSDIVDAVVLEFPSERLAACGEGGHDEGLLQEELLQSVKRHYCLARGEDQHNVGAIFTIILLNVASAIIVEIVKWWFSKQEHRDSMAIWKTQGRKRNG